MSVTTTFDERKQEAKDSLATAIRNLQECTNENTWGYSDMNDEYIDELIQIIAQLMLIKRKL